MKMQSCGGLAACRFLVFITLARGSTALVLLRGGQSQDAANATAAAANFSSTFDSLSPDVKAPGQCSLMGGMVLPEVSARCCFSIQVATQRGLSEYGLEQPCKATWQCEADGVTPAASFEEQARKEVCQDPKCLVGVQSAMKANWKTAKAATYMGALCDATTVSVAEGTKAGLIRASMEGMGADVDADRPGSGRRRRKKKTKQKKKPAMCFPGEAMVQVLGRGAVPMASLEIGESVLTGQPQVGAALSYEPVLDWIHVAKGSEATFATIRHEWGILRASPGHLVFAASGAGYVDVPASTLRKGDVIFAMAGSDLAPSRVLAVDHSSVSLGMYAPLTDAGTIVVDGVLASNYATPSLEVRLPHWLAHAGLFPVRAYHSFGLAAIVASARAALFGEFESKVEADVVDIMHPYFRTLLHGLRVDRLLFSA